MVDSAGYAVVDFHDLRPLIPNASKSGLPVSLRHASAMAGESASPAVTELVFALGCGQRVVGVSDYTTHPPEARDVPSVGGRQPRLLSRQVMARPP